jgi:hypothetical protein
MNRIAHPLSRALAAAACAGMALTASPAAAADAPAKPAAAAAAAAAQGAASMPAAATPRAARADAPPTRQALETLLGALPAPAQAEGPPRQRTTAQRGETLDAAIRRTMGDMPFKENFLRGVFLELNAGAVQPGTTRLIAGAQLQVPHLEDLRSHLLRVLGPQQPVASQSTANAAAQAAADKRHWVRFP